MAYWKKLKNTDAVPVLKDELVLDTTPTVNSTNPVTSDGVARAIAGASGEVPVVTENDNGKVLSAVYDEGGPAVEWAEAPSGIPDMAGKNGKILGAVDNGGTMEAQWIDKPNPSAGDGIAISEQGAISAVGGTGITVTAESTTTKSITVHSQDYVPTWTSTEQHTVDYVSLLDSNIVSDIQNGGIDVTLAYPFYQFVDYSSSLNDYLDDWQSSSYQSRFKAYAAIVELDPNTTLTPTAYFGNIQNRLVLGEVSAPWIASNFSYPAIAANTVVRYDFDEVNTSLSTITLSSVLANLSNYCMTVLFYDSRIMAFDNGAYHSSCTLSGVTGAGDYTTGSYQGTAPSAINVTNPVPPFDLSTDVGKVLTVTSNGLEWVTPS